MDAKHSTIAYILKGYPRNSEVFITHEMYLLECMGLSLQIFSAFKPTDQKVNAVVGKVTAPVTYLPEVNSAIDSHFAYWMFVNFFRYALSHLRVFFTQPLAYMKTAWEAWWLSIYCRPDGKLVPKKVFYKDFIRSGAIAWQVLQSPDIQHLHAHFCHGATTMAMFVSHLTGIPFSFTAHAKDIYLPKLNPGKLLKYKLEQTQFVVTCADANRQYLQTIAPAGLPIQTIYHGLDTSEFVPSKKQESDLPLILSIGRFVEKKGFSFLVQACRILKERGYAFRCQIIGEADNQSEVITALIQDLRVEEMISIGPGRTQEELRDLYKQATVFALPCQIVKDGDRDGIPNVLAEAMAMGVPVVSTQISGIPELISNRVHGLLVPQQDASALASALEEVLNHPHLREQLGKAGRERICEIFDSKTNTISLKNLFLSCMAKRREESPSIYTSPTLLEKR